MSKYATLDELTSGLELDVEDVKIGGGKTVQVKGLTRYEYSLALKNSVDNGSVNMVVLETNLLRFGMSNPELDMNQAENFMKKASAGAIDPILKAIRRLSNLSDDAEKSNV